VTASLATPHPMGALLPALYQDDDLAQRLTGGLDQVLAPVLCLLDCLDSYVDPRLAPEDFVSWMAAILGVEPDEGVPLDRRRAMVRRAADVYAMHGTRLGISAAVRAVTGVEPEVTDSGGVSWSFSSADPEPDPAPPSLDVVVPETAAVDAGVVERIVADAAPAFVVRRVRVKGAAP
jgi:phage tail-like protein